MTPRHIQDTMHLTVHCGYFAVLRSHWNLLILSYPSPRPWTMQSYIFAKGATEVVVSSLAVSLENAQTFVILWCETLIQSFNQKWHPWWSLVLVQNFRTSPFSSISINPQTIASWGFQTTGQHGSICVFLDTAHAYIQGDEEPVQS